LFTDVTLDEIAEMEGWEGARINQAKEVLATQATALAHGRVAAELAAETARKTFSEGVAAEGLPTVEVAEGELTAGIAAFALFVKAGLAASNGEARRLIQGGGARVNDVVIEQEGHVVDAGYLVDGVVKLSAGKKRHVLVKVKVDRP
jgi:tyrosyl-tRNA synthetase